MEEVFGSLCKKYGKTYTKNHFICSVYSYICSMEIVVNLFSIIRYVSLVYSYEKGVKQ
jgi:hypothetical protein